jgi:4-hydroxybenzoate polyprenyltransferase
MERDLGMAVPRSLAATWGMFITMRPWQWTKNLLVFLPLIFSVGERWTLQDPLLLGTLFLRGVLTFLILCALSGTVYIINDIFDRENDRLHPVKSRRPIASGVVPVPLARITAALMLVVGLVGALFLGTGVVLVASAYLLINIVYSSNLKHLPILDVMALSSGFILRVVAGSLVIGVVTSPWLYVTVGLGALFLSLGKRYTELRSAGDGAHKQRSVLGLYTSEFLSQLITVTATSTLLAYSLYTFSAENVPDSRSMMLTIPFVVFGLFRYLYILNSTDKGENPEIIMVKDKPLILGIAFWGLTSVILLALGR